MHIINILIKSYKNMNLSEQIGNILAINKKHKL